MLYKTYNIPGYFIEEMIQWYSNAIEKIQIRATQEEVERVIETLQNDGIEIISVEEEILELDYAELNRFNKALNERKQLLIHPVSDEIPIYNKTPKNKEVILSMFEDSNETQRVDIALNTCFTSKNKNLLLTAIGEIEFGVNFYVKGIDEHNEIWISIKENDIDKFVETAQQLHIPFKIK